MSRFKSIRNKIIKKSSVSINEKIAALNKELEKTGISNVSEMMRTDNVLSTSTFVPEVPEVTSEVPDPNPDNGITSDDWEQPLGNDADGNAASAAPTSFPKIWTNAGYLDPTDGLLNKSDLNGDGANHPIYEFPPWTKGPVPAGSIGGVQIEVGGMNPGVVSGTLSSDGFTQDDPRQYPTPNFKTHPDQFKPVNYWVPFSIFNPFIDSYWPNNSAGNTPQYQGIVKGTESGSGASAPMALFTAYVYTGGGRATYVSQEGRPPTTKDPIKRGLEDEPIYPGPIESLFELGKRAFEWLFGKAKKEKKEKDYEKNRRKNRPKPVGSETEPDPTESDSTEKDYEKNRRENRPEVTGEVGKNFANEVKKVAGEKLKELGDFWKDVVNTAKTIKSTVDSIPTSGNALVGWAKNNNPDDPDYRKNDPRSPNYEGPLEAKTSSKWKNDVGKQLKKSLPDKSDYEFDGQEGPTWEERLKNSKDGKVKLNDYEIKKLSDEMSPGVNGDMRFHTLFNSLPPEVTEVTINSEGEIEIESNYRFTDRDDVSSGGPLMKNWVSGIAERDKTGDTFPFLDKENGKPIGDVHDINLKLKLNMNGGNKSNWPRKELQKESYITEGVGLGLYEPEAMNVDLSDIRKGVMPEYPKKPPAEMIDGYHEKSPLRPKPLENEPYVKISKADLIRNHRLKQKEADEMMDTINMMNAYIKAHPEDLIHAQMRYPKDDPRLAELNWKMDQMLEAGEEYLDSNFKENQTLYKRATDRTKKNIKLTDPEYVQKHYDELRGTPKPKKTKLVGRLGKHLNKYESKSLFKHVNSKNFKKINEQKIERKEQVKQIQKEIKIESEEKKNDWRKDLGNNTY